VGTRRQRATTGGERAFVTLEREIRGAKTKSNFLKWRCDGSGAVATLTTARTHAESRTMDDPELKAKARDVFTALTANGASFTEFLDADFSAWRVFFRGLKELSGDQTSALGEIASGGFLGRNDITMSNWGKSVKERSELFKEEFERFISLREVREALAKDLGMAAVAPPQSPLAAMRAASRETSPAKENAGDVANETAASPTRLDGGDGAAAYRTNHGIAQQQKFYQSPPPQAQPQRPQTLMAKTPLRPDAAVEVVTNPSAAAVVVDISATHVPLEHHRERIMAYLNGFETLLESLRAKTDAVAAAALVDAPAAVEELRGRLDVALDRVGGMIAEESGAA
jgi:hypothetical protein